MVSEGRAGQDPRLCCVFERVYFVYCEGLEKRIGLYLIC